RCVSSSAVRAPPTVRSCLPLRRSAASRSICPSEARTMNPEGSFTFFVMRPLSDLFLWTWRLERRFEFLYRPQFDRWLRPPLFAFFQAVQHARRNDQHLALAEERVPPDEAQHTREVTEEIARFIRENYLPGGAQRF